MGCVAYSRVEDILENSYRVLFTKYYYSKQIKKHNWEQRMALVMV